MKKIAFSCIAFVMAIAVSMMVKYNGVQTSPAWPESQTGFLSEPDYWHPAEKLCAISDSVPQKKWHPAEKLA